MTEHHLQQQKDPVWLEAYQSHHLPGLEQYKLTPEQQQFTGMPIEMLLLAEMDPHRHPVVIMAKTGPVGFFVLYDGEEVPKYTDHPAAIVLRAFSVSLTFQGRGYAKRGLMQLGEYVHTHFPEAKQVVLAVNEQNGPARSLYLGCGFKDNGRSKPGPMGLQYMLFKSLD